MWQVRQVEQEQGQCQVAGEATGATASCLCAEEEAAGGEQESKQRRRKCNELSAPANVINGCGQRQRGLCRATGRRGRGGGGAGASVYTYGPTN